MCEVVERINNIEALLAESLSHQKELEKQQSYYDTLLSDIDHELEYTKLSAPHLAKITRYRQEALRRRREVKKELHKVTTFNIAIGAKSFLDKTKNGAKLVQKNIQKAARPDFYHQKGVIGKIMDMEDVRQFEMV
jgi:hypothetical protein